MSSSSRQRLELADVAVVIVNYRTPDLTMRCLASLRVEKEALPLLRVVVVDGGSDDGSAAKLAEGIGRSEYREWVSVLPLAINGGFGWANNQAILKLAQAEVPPEFVHLLNPDTEVRAGAVANLVRELQEHPRCGAAGSQLLSPDGQRTPSAFRFPSAGRELINAAQSPKVGALIGVAPTAINDDQGPEVDWVTGASVMFRAEALRQTGLFDDGFFLYFEEVELMHRLRSNGWTVRHVSGSEAIHFEGAATGAGARSSRLPRYWYESRRRYFALTGGKSTLIRANFAWGTGRAVWGLAKTIFGRSRPDGLRSSDLLRFGSWPREQDQMPSIATWGEAPGRLPAWMARG